MLQQDTIDSLGRIQPLDQLPASAIETLCENAPARESSRRDGNTRGVGDIIRREPVATDGSISIQAAAQLMEKHKISSLVVTDETGAPVGIMTDRDLREKIVARVRELSQPVSSIMSSPG